MKRRLWAPILAVGLAALILVPSTFAVGESGTTLYAQLGTNRFPAGQGAADASLTFNSERDIVLRISIFGPAGTVNAVRVYADGTCTNPGIWVINRTTNAGPSGPFLTVNSNSGMNTIQVNQLDVDRIREELAGNPNETFALMVARVINGQNYRTCTAFRATPFPPLTTTTTTAATPTTTVTAPTTTGQFTTRTVTTTIGSQTLTFTLTEPVTTTAGLTTRTSTGFSTGTTVQTLTSTGTAITLSNFPTMTTTITSTGLSTGSTTTVSTDATTTATLTVPNTTAGVTTTITTVQGSTATIPAPTTTLTTTSTFTTPVTTVTLTTTL